VAAIGAAAPGGKSRCGAGGAWRPEEARAATLHNTAYVEFRLKLKRIVRPATQKYFKKNSRRITSAAVIKMFTCLFIY
jgi:hypothetical protein